MAAKRPCTRAVRGQAALLENEDVLQGHDVGLHSGDLGDAGHAARAVAQARALHQDVDRRGDLLPDGGQVHIGVGQRHHHFQARNGVARAVGVHRGERAVVAGIHGLQHVERFFAAHLAHDDAVGPHAQAVDQQLPLPHRALAFEIRGPRFQARQVGLFQLQFGGVLDGDECAPWAR